MKNTNTIVIMTDGEGNFWTIEVPNNEDSIYLQAQQTI